MEPKPALRRAATAEAAQFLGTIVASGSAKLSRAIWQSSLDKVGGAVSGAKGFAKDAGSKILAKVRPQWGKGQPEAV
jgi:hypothetical protein